MEIERGVIVSDTQVWPQIEGSQGKPVYRHLCMLFGQKFAGAFGIGSVQEVHEGDLIRFLPLRPHAQLNPLSWSQHVQVQTVQVERQSKIALCCPENCGASLDMLSEYSFILSFPLSFTSISANSCTLAQGE